MCPLELLQFRNESESERKNELEGGEYNCKKSSRRVDPPLLVVFNSASAAQAHRVLRISSTWNSYSRPSIIERGQEFFVRYGEKERQAVASFDFLDEINPHESLSSLSSSETSTTTSSELENLLPTTNYMQVSPL